MSFFSCSPPVPARRAGALVGILMVVAASLYLNAFEGQVSASPLRGGGGGEAEGISSGEKGGEPMSMIQGSLKSIQKHSHSEVEEPAVEEEEKEETCYKMGMKSTARVGEERPFYGLRDCWRYCWEIRRRFCTHYSFDMASRTCYLHADTPNWVSQEGFVGGSGGDCEVPSELVPEDVMVEKCAMKDVTSLVWEVRRYDKTTLDECQEKCRNASDCTEMTFHVTQRSCQLHNRGTGGFPKYEFMPGFVTATPDCDLSEVKQLVSSTCFYDHALSTAPEDDGAEDGSDRPFYTYGECRLACKRSPTCTHFVYNKTWLKCNLKKGTPEYQRTGDESYTVSSTCIDEEPKVASLDTTVDCLKRNAFPRSTRKTDVYHGFSLQGCQDFCKQHQHKCDYFTFHASPGTTCSFYQGTYPTAWDAVSDVYTIDRDCDIPAYVRKQPCLHLRTGSLTHTFSELATHTLQECQQACKERSECSHYTFQSTWNRCWLKTGDPIWLDRGDETTATPDCDISHVHIDTGEIQNVPEGCEKPNMVSAALDKWAGFVPNTLEQCRAECMGKWTHIVWDKRQRYCRCKLGSPIWKHGNSNESVIMRDCP